MTLRFADGVEFTGRSFGAAREARGPVTFLTRPIGSAEALMDPAHRGRVLVLPYPWQFDRVLGPSERRSIEALGLVVPRYWGDRSRPLFDLQRWLAREGVPAIDQVDVRRLMRHLRARRPMEAMLVPSVWDGQEPGRELAALSRNMRSRDAELVGWP
jgi:carbamoylphosphate synthase small subunit